MNYIERIQTLVIELLKNFEDTDSSVRNYLSLSAGQLFQLICVRVNDPVLLECHDNMLIRTI